MPGYANFTQRQILEGLSPAIKGVTLSGTGSATVRFQAFSGNLIVECAAAQSGQQITIPLPVNASVIDVKTIHGNATSSAVQITDGDDNAISDVIAIGASDTDVDRATEIDDANNEIAEDANLKVAITTGAFTGLVIIELDHK